MTDPACRRCEGFGLIADTEEGEPWSAWASLPHGSDLAVAAGLVQPIPCPDCTADDAEEEPPPVSPASAAAQLAAVVARREAWRERMATFAAAEAADDEDLADAIELVGEGAALIVDALNVLAAAWLETAERARLQGKPLPGPGVPR